MPTRVKEATYTVKKTIPKQTQTQDSWLSKVKPIPGQINQFTTCATAKTLVFKAQILNWIAENKDCQMVVFTNLKPMLDILHNICDTEDWSCAQYHGDIKPAERQQIVAEFQNKGFQILLATLRTGGIGLNLTAATKVLILDPVSQYYMLFYIC